MAQIRCTLCPCSCLIEDGKLGKCKARTNKNGIISPANYGFVSTAIVGPIEQKGIYHFWPSAQVLSVGGVGCNLHCSFCQNFSISQVAKSSGEQKSPEDIVSMALEEKAEGIAFTFNEPLVTYEFVRDVFTLARPKGLITVLKTAGFIEQHIFAEICRLCDCVNIDLKGDHKVYSDICGVDPSAMDLVLLNIGTAALLTHVEISLPVITDFENSCIRAAGLLLMDVGLFPLHLVRFIPDFRMKNVYPMSIWKMTEILEYLSHDFPYVYADFLELQNITKCAKGRGGNNL